VSSRQSKILLERDGGPGGGIRRIRETGNQAGGAASLRGRSSFILWRI
jgi:hypothetical protein